MIEAYEIGVTLALRDGVSESISQAQRNVEALQKAIDSSGLSIRALNDAGARAISLVTVRPQQEKEQKKVQPPAEQSGAAEIFSAPGEKARPALAIRADETNRREPAQVDSNFVIERTATESPGEMIMPALVNLRPVPLEEPVLERSDTAPPMCFGENTESKKVELVAPSKERLDLVPQLRTAAPRPQREEQSPFLAGDAEQLIEASPVFRTKALPHRQTTEVPDLPLVALPPDNVLKLNSLEQNSFTAINVSSTGQAGVDGRAPVPSHLVDSMSQPTSAEDEKIPSWMDSETLESPQVAAGIAPDVYLNERLGRDFVASRYHGMVEPEARAVRHSPSTRPPMLLTMALPQTDSEAQSAAPQARGNAQGPLGGNVFLDGALVGRWMSRFLKREVERAESGPTGFDAKRGRLLPGVTVGG